MYPAPKPEYIAAKHHGGGQSPLDKHSLIVIHSAVVKCRPGAARGVAEGFARGDRVASAHYSVDPGEVIQSVHDHTIAYHCGYNVNSLAIELCEMPSWKIGRWNPLRFRTSNRRRLWRRAVNLTANLCLSYNVRPYYVGVKALRAWDAGGLGGITTHWAMTNAFHRSTHWDPGAWPRRRFLRAVRREMRTLSENVAKA